MGKEKQSLHCIEMSDDRPFKCPICNAQYSQKGQLVIHEKNKHKIEGIKYECQDCSSKFSNKTSLTHHVNTIHKGIKFKCDQCTKEFIYDRSKTRHVQSVHNQKKYLCTLCDYQATTNSSLR